MTQPERKSYSLEESRLIRERQAGRAKMMGLVLGALAVLFFAITVVKIGFT